MLVQQVRADTECQAHHQLLPEVSGEINSHHDIVVNILLNTIHKQRGLITHEQRWEDRKMVKTAHDEITIWTEHWRSEAWKAK